MSIKNILFGTASALLIGTVCAFGAYPAMEVSAADETEIEINEANFPDSIFRAYVSENFDVDPKDGKLSSSEIKGITDIDVYGKEIGSLQGIEYFTALTWLDCSNNSISKLDVSKNTALTNLICSNNRLTTLDVSQNTDLLSLYCENNNISELDVNGLTALSYLVCKNNNISELDVNGLTALIYLSCENNNISELDVSNLTALETLNCGANKISKLDVSKCINLYGLSCEMNKITTLDISDCLKLNLLYCVNNYIQHKSDIKGMNEEAIEVCYYNPQYYEGYEVYYTDAEPKFSKVITGENRDIYPVLSGEKVIGNPDASVFAESGGITFTPKFESPVYTTNDPDVRFDYNTQIISSTDGEHTVTLTIKDGIAKGTDLVKDFVITAVSKEQHQTDGHEFTRYVWGYALGVDNHYQMCFCGEYANPEPHEFDKTEESIDYATGKRRFLHICTKCSFSLTFYETGDVLEDEDTDIVVSGLGDTDLSGKSLDVDEVEPDDLSSDVVVKIGDDVVAAYDIKLIDDKSGAEVQPDGFIRITIPVPEGVDVEKVRVYHVADDGTVTDMNAKYDPETKILSFVTDHLSIYVIAAPKTGPSYSGNINGDDAFDIDDVIDLARSILTTTESSENPYLPQGDRDGNGVIDIDDVILLARELIM